MQRPLIPPPTMTQSNNNCRSGETASDDRGVVGDSLATERSRRILLELGAPEDNGACKEKEKERFR